MSDVVPAPTPAVGGRRGEWVGGGASSTPASLFEARRCRGIVSKLSRSRPLGWPRPDAHCEQIDDHYVLKKVLGRGAYGVVVSCLDKRTGGRCAVKKVANAFDNATDARRTLREVLLLRHLLHENVVRLLEVLRPPSLADFKDVYLVYELMDTDLHQILRSPQPLTDEHCAYFLYQVCEAAGRASRVSPALSHSRACASDPAGRGLHPLRERAAPRPEAVEPALERQLRPEDL